MIRSPPALHVVVGIARSEPVVAMTARATQGVVMALAAAAIVLRGTPTEQGFYFAFIGFGILLQLCDFGLSYASLQSASHLRARDDRAAIALLAFQALRINAAVTLLAAPVVAVTGWVMFERATGHALVAWQAPWLCFIALVACNQLTGPYVFLVEGGLSVSRAWRFRLRQELASGIALLVVLASGWGLWALVAYYGSRLLLGAAWMLRAPLAIERSGSEAAHADWRRDLWPFQWRVGVGAISGYLVFQAFGPILFALQGPESAGRFALSLSAMNAIVMVTTAWPVSQAAHFGLLLGRGETGGLLAQWKDMLVRSSAFAVAGVLCVGAAFVVLDRLQPAVAARFAGTTATLVLVASALVHHVAACVSVVLRAQRRDPLLGLNVVGGVVTLACLTAAASFAGVALVAVVYLACVGAMLGCATLLFRKFATTLRMHRPSC